MKVGFALSAWLHLLVILGVVLLPSVMGGTPPRPVMLVKVYAGDPNASDPHPGRAGRPGGPAATPKPTVAPTPKAVPKATAAPTPKPVAEPTPIPIPDPNAKPIDFTIKRESGQLESKKVAAKLELKREVAAAPAGSGLTRETAPKPAPDKSGPGEGGTGADHTGMGFESGGVPLDPNFVYDKYSFFIALLVDKLTKNFMPPREPEDVLAQREAMINFVIEPDGKVVNVAVGKSSGSADFDKAAMDAVRAISPIEGGLPAGLKSGPLLVTAPFRGAQGAGSPQ